MLRLIWLNCRRFKSLCRMSQTGRSLPQASHLSATVERPLGFHTRLRTPSSISSSTSTSHSHSTDTSRGSATPQCDPGLPALSAGASLGNERLRDRRYAGLVRDRHRPSTTARRKTCRRICTLGSPPSGRSYEIRTAPYARPLATCVVAHLQLSTDEGG